MLFAARAQLLRQGLQGLGQPSSDLCQGQSGLLIHQGLLLICWRRRMTASAPFLWTVTQNRWPSSSTAQKRLWGYLVTHSTAGLRVLERHQLRLLAEEPLAVLRDQPPQHGGVVARKVLDMRGMAPGLAGEQPFLGQVLDEFRTGSNLPLCQSAQDRGPH